ncbi:MAG: hypothetical protein M0P59_14150 [Gallionella sp.]|nr:hypothetical protein [Gallionella sp.]MCK9355273.1 hypothetical protein [Gallionella sp.]
MDMIGNIQFIENRLGGRKPSQGKRRPEPSKERSHSGDESPAQTGEHPADSENDYHIGRIVDTTA